jgi:leucyl-tRNA synthetase
MTAERYEPSVVEPRWVEEWERLGLYRADDADETRPRFYSLDMYPYPSGDLHMGHLEAFSGGDVVARFKWMQGYNVLHPIGWDAFGLPAENAAIKRGIHPREWTYANIEQQAQSFKRLGISFDWSRRLRTCDPEYYRWNQWFFLKFLEAGIAYQRSAAANWCPTDKTVLANEQVVNGLCERCGTPVTKRELVQWFLRESDYGQRLLDDMALLSGWSERLLTIQRNWIGRSEGADVVFTIEETGEEVTIFTTRPDTLWGVTFFVLAAEHPLAQALVGETERRVEYDEFLERVRRQSEIERTSLGRRREGVFTGAHAINPVNGERIPVWVADYVLMEYGTGAIMAVPAHDQRDFEFARQLGLPVRPVIQPAGAPLDGEEMRQAWEGEGVMAASGPFDGTEAPGGIAKVVAWLEEQGLGTRRVRYRLRDWLISRQRYWGTPIPVIHCPSCGAVPVPEADLPVVLPDIEDYTPTETGSSPLAKVTDWVNVACPRCAGPSRRETDTMDTFVDSSWYFYRYCSVGDATRPFDPEAVARWLPAGHYTGGLEHATGHLIYSRFFTKVLHDLGLVPFVEFCPAVHNQGQVIMEGASMSKSRGNLVAPKEIVDRYGADTARVTMLFAGPFEDDVDWADVSPQGVHRWLTRVWRVTLENAERIRAAGASQGDGELRRQTHHAIEGVTRDIERFRFNTAIAKLMTLSNHVAESAGARAPDVAEAVDALLRMLAPLAPFISEELWHRLGRDGSIHTASWPVADPALAADEAVTMVVQVNGKVRDRIEVPPGIDEATMKELAFASDRVHGYLAEKAIVRTIVVPPKLVNIVVR